MNIKELTDRLEEQYPLCKAESWDNSGLQVGRKDKEIKKVFLALDATDEVLEEAAAWHADLLLTHHPLMLSGVRQVTEESLTGHKIYTLIRHDICHYAMHTNYDVVEMGEAAGNMLKLQNTEVLEVTRTDEKSGKPEGIGIIGDLPQPITAGECGQNVKQAFGLDTVKIFGDLDQVIKRVAICPGSGKSTIGTAIQKKAQAMITGDIGHHDGIDAVDQKMAVIDAGHYGVEHIFIERMEQYLKMQFPQLEVRKTESGNPFRVI